MKLAFAYADGRVACCLCPWEVVGKKPADAEKLALDHLRGFHDRVMVSREAVEKGGREVRVEFHGVRWAGAGWRKL